MTTHDFITRLFCRVDDVMHHQHQVPQHPQAKLAPSEVVTLGLLFALKGSGTRAFYRWVSRDLKPLFPHLPERTRLFRLLAAHHDWTKLFLATPTVLGICDSYGIELVHPMREGRSDTQIGKKGLSNHRWIVGAKLCLVLNQWGLIVDWDTDTANVSDQVFHRLIERFKEQMIVFTDTGFHASEGDPDNMKVCPRGTWNDRMTVETVLSMCMAPVVSKRSRIVSGIISKRAWRLPWLLSIFVCSGRACPLMNRDEYTFPSLSSVSDSSSTNR